MSFYTERPPIRALQSPTSLPQFKAHFINARYRVRVTEVSEDKVPGIKRHPNLDDDFVEIANAAAGPLRSSAASSGRSRGVVRLMNEIRAIAATSENKFDCYVSETDITFWKVVMEGPDGSPYAGGAFLFYLHADSYPTFAPEW